MKEKIEKYLHHLIVLAASATMLWQIGLAVKWMVLNIHTMPIFGDSGEYVNLTKTFELDEYRPIGYPLLLRVLTKIGELTGKSWMSALFLGQLIFSVAACIYLVYTLDKINDWHMKKYFKILFATYLVAIPMVTWMNFSVLTDSIALSALIIMIASLARLTWLELTDKQKIIHWILVGGTYALQALVRADRFYSVLVFIVILFVRMVAVKKKQGTPVRGKEIILILLAIVVSFSTVRCIDSLTQQKGRNGRIATSADFVLLDRIVWPNMVRNYDHFSEEIKKLVSIEDAELFDNHNNNAMYQMAPLIEEQVGRSESQRIYREMAATVWKYDKKLVISQISADLLAFICFPVEGLLIYDRKLNRTSKLWNVRACAEADRHTTWLCEMFYFHSILAMIAAAAAVLIFRRVKRGKDAGVKEIGFKGIGMLFGMSVLLDLWFSLGDGAPPNDRYALIVYVAWTSAIGAILLVRPDGRKFENSIEADK